MNVKIRDLRRKDQYKIDDVYLNNGYARICGVYATAVYNSLSRHANFHTQECFPSLERIADQHGITKPSVINAIKKLVQFNIISVKRKKNKINHRQLPNIYILIDKSEWNSLSDVRVNTVDSENITRVNQIDYKDNPTKETQLRKTKLNFSVEKLLSMSNSDLRLNSDMALKGSVTTIEQKFYDMCQAVLGIRPIRVPGKAKKVISNALNSLTEIQILDLFEEWFQRSNKTDDALIEITQALSPHNMNVYRLDNGIE